MGVERFFRSENGRPGKFGLGLTGLFICFVMVMSGFMALVPTVEDTEGYTYYSIYGDGSSSSNYRYGYAYYETYGASSYGKYSGSMVTGHFNNYYYRSWFGISVDDIDEKTLLYRANAFFRPSSIYDSQNCYFYLLDFDPSATASAQDIYHKLDDGYYLGSSYISGYYTYSFSIKGNAIAHLKNRVSSGDGYIYFGIKGTDSSSDYIYWSASSQYLRIYGDRSAPSVPSVLSVSPYQTSSSMSVSCTTVSDLPSGTNYGGVEYQFGLFSFSSMDSLIRTTDWSSSSSAYINDMADGSTYYIRARTRDKGGWTSHWSSYRTTTVDQTPPSMPQVYDLPEYTNGTTVDLTWTPSLDSTSGLDYYQINYAPAPDFTGEIIDYDYSNTYESYPTLTSGTTYYFTLSAYDNAGQWSGLSPISHTTIDDDPPSAPVMMKEPPFTAGDNNTFGWHPSVDDGVGVHHYKVQLSTTDEFLPADIVYDVDVNDTLVQFDGLSDMERYYARVKAVDAFHHESDWSRLEWSVQDHSGPGELGLMPLMEYMPEGNVPLVWEGAEDSGSGVGWYKVNWSQDPTFTTGVTERDHVLGQSFQVPDLAPGVTWYFKVTSYDLLGNPGEEEMALTTIDAEAPSQPVIDALDPYSGGRTRNITWSGSTDSLSGLDHYIVNVYTSPDRVGLAFTVHTTETTFVVPGLSDGTTYYYEVIAIDRAGNEVYSTLVHSTQDTRGPSIPGLMPIDEMSSTGLIDIDWSECIDESGGPVEYQVEWANDPMFSENVQNSPWMEGTHYTVFDRDSWSNASTRSPPEDHPLQDGTHYIRLRARDQFEQMSSYGLASIVVVDTTPPPAPVLDPIEEFSGVTSVKLTWAPVEDGAGTDVEYQVRVYENETGEPIMVTPWTAANELILSGLEEGALHYMRLVARDEMGWESEPSEVVHTTTDVTPPVLTTSNGGIFGSNDLYIHGEVYDSGCGVKRVEVSHDMGLSWEPCTFESDAGEWSFAKSALSPGTHSILVRALDNGGNLAPTIPAYIDNEAPSVTIGSPLDGSEVNGAVQVTGTVADSHLDTFSVEYKMKGEEDWTSIIPGQRAAEASGLLATWTTSGLKSGEYLIRVGGVDLLGQTSYSTVNVTLLGANLGIEPAQITFSNAHPEPGEKVKVMVTVSNYGDSPAEDVTVTVYDGEEEIDEFTGLTIPANGFVTLTTEITADGTHEITARATSEMYDTGEMSEASTLETVEEEFVLEDFGGIIGLIALILALIAVILAVVLSGRKKKEKAPKEKKEEMELTEDIEERPVDKPAEKPSAPALQPPTAETKQQPQLPTPPPAPQQRDQLPSPSVAPKSMPPDNGPTPPQPQYQQPQLKAAPASKPDNQEQQVTYMGPNKG